MSISIDLDLPVDPSNGKRCNIARIVSGGGGGDPLPGLLPAGYFAPSRLTMQWVNPNGSETARSAFLWSHSQFDYERRITVLGGSAPYIFYLTSPVAGVTLTPRAPERNPYLFLWCDITIDHNQFASGTKTFEINCMDQNETVISLEMTVTVDDSKFIFAQKGGGGSAGTLASPYDDLVNVYTNDEDDTTHAGKILVLRSGTYSATNFDTGFTALPWSLNKPSAIINYPGESWVIDANVNILVGESTGTGFVDYYFRGGEMINSVAANVANRKVFAMFGSHKRVVFDSLTFTSPSQGTSGTDNEACIYATNNGFDSHTEISFIDLKASGLPSSGNGFALVDFYGVSNSCVVGGRVTNSTTGQGIWLKARNLNIMIAGVDYYAESGQTVDRAFYPNQADSGLNVPPGVVQFLGCRAYRASDGLFAESMVLLGDSNQSWGTVYMDRCSIVGAIRDGGDDASILGSATIYGCIVINNLTDKLPTFATLTNNLTGARALLRTYLETDGNTVSTLPQYGQIGATFIQAEAA
jgi:hypothetical protein